MWSHPTHSTEIFPNAEDQRSLMSARTALTDARKLLHEIRTRLIDGSGNSPARKQAQAWGSAQRDVTLTRHANKKSDVVTYMDKKGSASPHTVAERKDESLIASTTSMERLALDEAEAMRSMESMPFLLPDSNSSLPDEQVIQKRNTIEST